MKFSLSWLKDCLDTQANAATIAATLTAIGLEVESVDDPATKLSGFRIARVLSAAPHPQADRLQLLSVDLGDGAPLQVVCGAANARAGLVGVLGLPGATVPTSGMVLKAATVRGAASNGMMCSARELDLGDDHDGIIELPADAPVGAEFANYHGSDPVFTVAITPNRADCMGVYGIARDLAAAGLGALKPINRIPPTEGSRDPALAPCSIAIHVEDIEGCPAFYGRTITGLRNGVSPPWLQARLQSADQRPISAVVDITNYVMLTYGRPVHAYDLAKLSGAVCARRARPGEACLALNGKTYELTAEMTVIADDQQVHDIAGIMGGIHSGCSPVTRDVLLEVAYFDPARIAQTGRALSLSSDARIRFERGVDPAFVEPGLEVLTALIVQICGGEASQAVHAGSPPIANRRVRYNPALCASLGGVIVSDYEQQRILAALGFAVDAAMLPWTITAPSWRGDIDAAPDIVEEVVRIHGLHQVCQRAIAAIRRGRPPHRHPCSTARAPPAPRCCRARSERGHYLVVYTYRSSRALRRCWHGGVAPREPDQRRYESDAPLAACGTFGSNSPKS